MPRPSAPDSQVAPTDRGRPRTREPGGRLFCARRLVLVAFLLGLLGTGAELLLIGHHESVGQAIPLVMIGLALAATAWQATRPSLPAMRVFQLTMILFVASGAAGTVLHYCGSREFQREAHPSLGELALFVKAIRAKAPPLLAPGAMAELGLLGLIYAYRHPILSPAGTPSRT